MKTIQILIGRVLLISCPSRLRDTDYQSTLKIIRDPRDSALSNENASDSIYRTYITLNDLVQAADEDDKRPQICMKKFRNMFFLLSE